MIVYIICSLTLLGLKIYYPTDFSGLWVVAPLMLDIIQKFALSFVREVFTQISYIANPEKRPSHLQLLKGADVIPFPAKNENEPSLTFKERFNSLTQKDLPENVIAFPKKNETCGDNGNDVS